MTQIKIIHFKGLYTLIQNTKTHLHSIENKK